jgi:hypothetical protein
MKKSEIRVNASIPVNQDALVVNIIRYRQEDAGWITEYGEFADGDFQWIRYQEYDVIRPAFVIPGLMEVSGEVVDEKLLAQLKNLAKQASSWGTTL